MGRRTVARLRDEADGAILIEFALTLPLLLLILFGIIDFGFVFRDYHVITNAAREGARVAVLPGYDTKDVQDRVDAFLRASGVTPGPPPEVVDGSFEPGSGGLKFTTKAVRVRIPYTFVLIGPIAQVFGRTFGTVTLSAYSEMRTEVAGGP